MSKNSKSNSKGKVHGVESFLKSDSKKVIASSTLEPEDEFSDLYDAVKGDKNTVLKPTFNLKGLAALVSHNNILSQCVEAMEVNVDGTGHDFYPIEEGGTYDENEYKTAKDFFTEPFFETSFIQIRRAVRRDLESTGNGFIEVIRALDGTVVALRHLSALSTRFIRLDEEVGVTKPINRGGVETTLTISVRERRFIQKIGSNKIYYREFGASRELNAVTGEWLAAGSKDETEDGKPIKRATEVIAFNVNTDHSTPYGIPRWINQMPSILGSRKAEEQNLEFLDSGGMPPAMIFIQGGSLAEDSANQARQYLSGKNDKKYRAVIIEAISNSGSLDNAGQVKVQVERFGADTANDAMYSTYDKTTEDHVRVGFRLPPIFVGRSQDYSYATAVISYMVAEEQVFNPERTEFDAKINNTIMKALGLKTIKFVSKPITLKTLEDKFRGLALVSPYATSESMLEEVNSITGMDLKPREGGQVDVNNPQANTMVANLKKSGEINLATLSYEWAQAMELVPSNKNYTKEDVANMAKQVKSLDQHNLQIFKELVNIHARGELDDNTELLIKGCQCGDH